MAPRLLSSIFLAVMLTACSSSTPTGPGGPVTPVAATYEGVWTITYTVAECGGFRQCVHYRGDSRTAHLHLMASAGGYEGVVQTNNLDQISVSGSVGADGRLTLTGVRPAAAADHYEIEVEALTLPVPGIEGAAGSGAIRIATRGPSGADFFGNAITAGPITVAELTPPPNGPRFTGKWGGFFAGKGCTATGWPHCYPYYTGQTFTLIFELTQSGATVAGDVKMGGTTIPVSGTTTGDLLSFSGSASPPSSGVVVTHRIDADGLQLDKIGRLSGDLRLVTTWEWKDGRGTWVVSYPAIPLHSVARSFR